MKRTKPLKRRTRLKARRATPRRSSRVRDPAYMDWVRTRMCSVGRLYGYHEYANADPMVAHHAGRRGAGQKCSDHETIPMHQRCHTEWHAGSGHFKGWTQAQRRSWAIANIAQTQRWYAAAHPGWKPGMVLP